MKQEKNAITKKILKKLMSVGAAGLILASMPQKTKAECIPVFNPVGYYSSCSSFYFNIGYRISPITYYPVYRFLPCHVPILNSPIDPIIISQPVYSQLVVKQPVYLPATAEQAGAVQTAASKPAQAEEKEEKNITKYRVPYSGKVAKNQVDNLITGYLNTLFTAADKDYIARDIGDNKISITSIKDENKKLELDLRKYYNKTAKQIIGGVTGEIIVSKIINANDLDNLELSYK